MSATNVTNATTQLRSSEKVANYSVMAILLVNTMSSMRRFKSVPKDELITQAYQLIKKRAAK